MSNSGRKINYAVRPAKNIERKMMRDFFLRLRSFSPLESYRYVGFGSKYFVDFVMFHKILNINEMISIEADVNNRARYEFNKPYSNITMEWGKSSEVLPKIVSKGGRAIYWLDYDGTFEKYMLDDIATITESIESGSVLSISFNCETLNIPDQNSAEALREQLIKMVGNDYVKNSLDLRGWRSSKNLAIFIKNCIADKIISTLKSRNYALDDDKKINAEQKLFFTYADGASMATLAYVFFEDAEKKLAENCRFSDLYFVRDNEEPFNISTPNLTIKEIRHLMEIRPNIEKINNKIFSSKDVESIWENYRYFPGFSEIESY